MKLKSSIALGLALCLPVCSLGLASRAQAQSVLNIEDYNKQLPFWGVSWAPGAGATNGYYPTFYTGFAMRQQDPSRIHIRLSRGNNTRLSVILDQDTVSDYLFDLVKRADVYKRLVASGRININPSGGKMLPQASMFEQIVNSPVYGIRAFVDEAKAGRHSPQALYKKSLDVLAKLNPGRVFPLKLDLKAAFLQWGSEVNASAASSEQGALDAINRLLWGRVNMTTKPTTEQIAKLNAALAAARGPEAAFLEAALSLFKSVTGGKYQIKVLDGEGQLVDALQCSASRCTLTYPEFTAIYPTGTAMASMTDQYGNRINRYATPGLWPFIDHSGGRDVDNIRDEPYYGWIPKMDYQAAGNGFHNPAVRFFSPSPAIKNSLGIPSSHNTLWAVKRGDVSHGCSRLPVGHVWEMRQVMPVENAKMKQVYYFGNDSRDFDVYDVNGDGKLEVMGVEYMISYGLQANTGLSSREGTGLEVSTDRKLEFYTKLYGQRNVFTVGNNQQILFTNPGVSMPSYLDLQKVGVRSRSTVRGSIPLYEQAYEKDKVQFYSSGGVNKALHRLMGRIRGCAPSADKVKCGEAASDSQVQAFVR